MDAMLAEMWRERAAMHEQQAREAITQEAAIRYAWFATQARKFAEFHAKPEAGSSTGEAALTYPPQTEPSPPEGGSR